MNCKLSFFIFSLLAIICLVQTQEDYSKKLRHELMNKRAYDKHSRPSLDWRTATQTNFSITITRIVELSAEKQTLTLDGWLKYSWIDEHLTWTPINFGGMTVIRLPSDDLWKPDITLYNGADLAEINQRSASTNALVYSNGLVIWIPPTTIKTQCQVDLEAFPYDTQTCNLTFGSWTFSSSEVNISFPDSILSELEMPSRSAWNLVSNESIRTDRVYDCCPGQVYPSLTLVLKLKRAASLFRYTVFLPQVVSLLSTLLVFWLPASALKSRLIIAVVALFLSQSTINTMAKELGAPINGVPYGVKCSGTLFLMGFGCVATSVLVNYISKKTKSGTLSASVAKVSDSKLAALFCIGNKSQQTLNVVDIDSEKAQKEVQEIKQCNEWLLIATLIDRVFFVLYIMVALCGHL